MALKVGESIAATGTLTQNTDSTLTFSSPVSIMRMENNTASLIYWKINGAISGGATPTDYDGILQPNSSYETFNESIDISTIHVINVGATIGPLPDNAFVAVGW